MQPEQFGITYVGMDMYIHSHIEMKQQLNKKSAMNLRESGGGGHIWKGMLGGGNKRGK